MLMVTNDKNNHFDVSADEPAIIALRAKPGSTDRPALIL